MKKAGKQTQRRRGIFILLTMMLMACGGSQKASQAGLLNMSVISDPKSFNPITARETSTTDILGFLFEALVKTNGKTYAIEPSLADTWSVSPDGTKWTFKLRQDVKWFDGAPFTAADVTYTYNDVIFNPKVASGARDVLQVDGKLFTVSMVDTFTVVFDTHKPFAPFLRTFASIILPRHAYSEIKDFNQALGINTPVDKIIGTGPFKIKEFTPGQRIVMERNPIYWLKDTEARALPRLKTLIISVVPDADAEIEWFKAGRTDFAGLRGHDWPVLSRNPTDYAMRNMGPRFTTTYIMFNQNFAGKIPEMKKAWFRNRAFREAVAWAIDRQTIIDGIYNGLAFEQHSAIPAANTLFHDSSVLRYKYDLETAARILGDARFKKNGSGELLDPSGNKVAFVIMTNAGNNERVRAATVIAEGLRKLGMDVKINAMDFNALVGRLDNELDWEACVLGLTDGPEPHNGANIWRVEGDLHMFNQKPRKPADDASAEVKGLYASALARWKSGIQPWERDIERLIEQGASTLDQSERWKIYSTLQKTVSRELPFIYTVSPAALYATRNRILGMDPSPLGSTTISAVTHNVEYLETR